MAVPKHCSLTGVQDEQSISDRLNGGAAVAVEAVALEEVFRGWPLRPNEVRGAKTPSCVPRRARPAQIIQGLISQPRLMHVGVVYVTGKNQRGGQPKMQFTSGLVIHWMIALLQTHLRLLIDTQFM